MLTVGSLAGCGSDTAETVAASSVATEASAAGSDAAIEATDTEVDETGAVATEAAVETESSVQTTEAGVAVASLAPDSATCVAFAKVKELNDRSGTLTAQFTSQMLAGAGAGDTSKVERAWEEFRVKFAADSEVVLPELQAAYATLSLEQPQYADDFANLDEVTGKLLTVFASMSFADLEKLEEKLAEAVPTEKTIAAGQASLKIDSFSRAACGIAFANT